MKDNRHVIIESDLVQQEFELDKGLPLPLLRGKFQVKEGFRAVLTEGGVYRETLSPGFYRLNNYKWFRDLKATIVDVRVKQLLIETSRKFSIKYPVPVQLELDISVEYQVRDPRRVALEFDQPLHSLYDRIIQAVDPIVSTANYEEVNQRRELLGERLHQKLIGMQLPKTIGIEVLNVIIISLKALDSGEDVLSRQSLDEFTTFRDWQVDSAMVQNSQMDLRTMLIQASPDERIQIVRDLIDKGYMDPAGGSLLQTTNSPASNDPSQVLNQLMSGFGNPQNPSGMPGSRQLNPGTNKLQSKDIHSRMSEEVRLLNSLPGAKVDTKLGVDQNGLHDGSHNFRVEVPKNSGGSIVCYFSCSPNYPDVPPYFALEVDGEDVPYESSNLRSWRKQYMVEIVREVINGVG